MLALKAPKAKFGDRRRSVLQQALPIGGIDPGVSDDLRAVERTNVFFVGLDDLSIASLASRPFFHQERFDRLRAQGRVRQWTRMVMAFSVWWSLIGFSSRLISP